MKSKTIAGFTALFGGGAGLQYFYLGEVAKAWLCLLVCWTMIPMFWGLIHGSQILSMTDCEFNEKYNPVIKL